MAFSDKDYYAILGVPPTASHQAIKSAFRKMALETHPDTNPDNQNNSFSFNQLKEAYDVLGNPQKRQDYHYARFFKPLKIKDEPTVAEILLQSQQLHALVGAIDPYRVDYDNLMNKIESILSVLYINILKQKATENDIRQFITEQLFCISHLPYSLAAPYLLRLKNIAGDSKPLLLIIDEARKRKKLQSLWEKYQTLAAFLIAIIICIIMYINS